MASTTSRFTTNDIFVYQSLFDTSALGTKPLINPDLELSLPGFTDEQVQKLRMREIELISELEVSTAGNMYEGRQPGSVDSQCAVEALGKLTAIIEVFPWYASAYVNRAQVLRMLIEGGKVSLDEDGSVEDDLVEMEGRLNLVRDLSKAIDLLKPRTTPLPPVSKFHAAILQQAYTHRGFILYRASRDSLTAEDSLKLLPEYMRILPLSKLEELASADFEMGGKYGSEPAKEMAVKTNPYAKACGAIVKQAMRNGN